MSGPEQIILRCTRCGVTSWQNVARQMGRSVDSVRSQFDPAYGKPMVCEVVEPEPIDENDTRSPRAKSPGLKVAIIALLERQSMSAEALAGVLCRPVNSIRARLDRLLDDGRVRHDGRYPRTWETVTRCEMQGRRCA